MLICLAAALLAGGALCLPIYARFNGDWGGKVRWGWARILIRMI